MTAEERLERLEAAMLAMIDALSASWDGARWQSYWDTLKDFEEEVRGFKK